MRSFLLSAALALAAAMPAVAQQQIVNMDVDLSVAQPAWPRGTGPRVAIDAAHANYHTIDGRYAPFAALLGNDGYQVTGNATPFTAESLAAYDILVIANAGATEDEAPDKADSAFTEAEIKALHNWVQRGGDLLLIADHAPFAGAAAELAKAFGVEFRNGYAIGAGGRGADLFVTGAGLADHPVTAGAGADPKVTQVRTFTGSAFQAKGAKPLLVLGDQFNMVYPAVAYVITPKDRREPIGGLLQGATVEIGKGRVAVMGEAAMFSSQKVVPQNIFTGFGAKGAEQNPRFTLNLMHWLSRRPGY